MVKITGTQTNKYLKYYFTKSWNNTRNIPECFLVCNFGVKQGQQGLTTKGEQIKTGVYPKSWTNNLKTCFLFIKI